MEKAWDVAVVGGGAAGLAAAVAAAGGGSSVVLLDRLPRLGKKILATGGGRCNLSNENLSPAVFSSTSPGLVDSVFGLVGGDDLRVFFQGLGLVLTSEEGRLYPATQQAATVVKALELEISRAGVRVELGFEVQSLNRRGRAFALEAADGRRLSAKRVVLSAGGKSYPALGSNGSGHELARRLGHRLIPPVPAAVPLLVKDPLCQALQGQRIKARASAWVDGLMRGEAGGEILFASYGLSGTAVLDVSEPVSVALNREGRKDVVLAADLVPFLSADALRVELERRERGGWPQNSLATGILPEKFNPWLSGWLASRHPESGTAASFLAALLKDKRFPVHGTRGWNEAEFTAGGVAASEVSASNLESKLFPGLYLAGEILDVQGPRGGFNLAWAWASGLVAGRAAAERP